MTRCNTLLCGNEAVWQLVKEGQPTVYKCETCHDKGCFTHDEGWTRIIPPAAFDGEQDSELPEPECMKNSTYYTMEHKRMENGSIKFRLLDENKKPFGREFDSEGDVFSVLNEHLKTLAQGPPKNSPLASP